MRKLSRIGCGMAALLWIVPVKAEEAGRHIYLSGLSASGGRIEARIGTANIRLPAERLPCANCHGKDRAGGREGGIAAPDIRWHRLSAPRDEGNGRTRPAYGIEALSRAIAEGIGPGGQTLDPAMPRYDLSAEDAAALVAYLVGAGDDPVPGVEPDRLTVGLLLPALATEAQSVAALIRAVFAEVNDAGGVFGRRIDLDVRSETENVANWPVLAVLSMLPNRAPPEGLIAAGVPVLGLQAPPGEPARGAFYVLPGLEQEALALLLHHARTAERPRRFVLLHGQDRRLVAVAAAVASRSERLGWPKPEIIDLGAVDPVALASRLEAEGTDTVFALGGQGRLASLLKASPAWRPDLLLAGSAEGASLLDLPAAVEDRLSIAYGLLPTDWSGSGSGRFQALHSRVVAGQGAGAPMAAAHTMARVIVEAITRVGRTLDQDRLIAGLESVGDLATGSTPPLSFRPGRHVGPQGSHVVRLDVRTGRLAAPPVWIAIP